MDFTEKFFGYFKYPDGSYAPYDDERGGGSFGDWRHYIWIVAVPTISVFAYRYFRKHPEKARRTIVTLAIVLLCLRLFFQVIKVTYGDERPLLRVLPFHQCAVIGILLPLVVLFDIKKLKMPIYSIAMMGGFATIAFGEYFTSSFMSFYSIEGIISHTILIVIPLIEIASGQFSLDIRKSWSVFVGMLLLMGWATLANEVFFKDYRTNYMFLKKSGFPDGFGGSYYFLLYVIIFIFVYSCMFIPPLLYKKSHKKLETENVSLKPA